jgi:hypothetical protein
MKVDNNNKSQKKGWNVDVACRDRPIPYIAIAA